MMVREIPAIYRITDMSVSDRPRERMVDQGADKLTNAELLAILLRVGVQGENAVVLGDKLLKKFGGLNGIMQAPMGEVQKVHGIGMAKAAQIKAAIEIGKRIHSLNPDEKPAITCPKDAADLVMYEMGALQQEELWVLLLDTRNRVIAIEKIYKGSLNSSNVRVAEIFKPAIARSAASIIVVHNHPSGDPSPSPEDLAVTRNFILSGKMLDIDVLDHLVIGLAKFVSLKEKGLGF
jgi:DNA repair protein RadC